MTRTIDQAGEKRASAIESLRALAALAVLEGHAFGASRDYGSAAHATFIDRILLGGGFSVFLFFALTGYLLYRPFARRDFGTGEGVALGRYAANRVFRILPLYYVVLIVYILVVDHGGTATTWWRSALFLENFFPATLARVDGVMWSLVVEVQFYVLLPLLAYCLGRLASGSARIGVAMLLGVGVLAELVRLVAVTTAVPVDSRWEYSLPATFVFFVPGMLLAILESQWSSLRPRLPVWATHGSTWFVASLPFWLVVMWGYNLDVLVVPATFLMVGGVALPLRRGALHRLMEWRPLAALGVASYSIYLWHFFVLGRLEGASWAPHSYLGLLGLCLPISCGVALVSYRLVEAPFLWLRQNWTSAPAVVRSGPIPELGSA